MKLGNLFFIAIAIFVFEVRAQNGSGSVTNTSSSSPATNSNRTPVGGVPRFVRDNPVPEVFFVDGNRSIVLSTVSGEAYNRMMTNINAALQKHSTVRLLIDKSSGVAVDIEGAVVESQSSSVYDENPPQDLLRSPEAPTAAGPQKTGSQAPAAPNPGPSK